MANTEEDYLTVDPQIPGQNFVCLSFISPENVLKNKDTYFLHAFLRTLWKNNDVKTEEGRQKFEEIVNLTSDGLEDKYKDFLYVNQETLEREFYEKNNFQTSVRGLKVRGVYDTQKEAEGRAKVLQKRDPKFNVFVAQVGYWLPWDPEPHRVSNQEYAEQGLNELVHKYKENQEAKDLHFQENIEYVKEQQAKKIKEHQERLKAEKEAGAGAGAGAGADAGAGAGADAGAGAGAGAGAEAVQEAQPVNVVDQSLKTSLDSVDPWLSRKANPQ